MIIVLYYDKENTDLQALHSSAVVGVSMTRTVFPKCIILLAQQDNVAFHDEYMNKTLTVST